jgi:hypothetical protein
MVEGLRLYRLGYFFANSPFQCYYYVIRAFAP